MNTHSRSPPTSCTTSNDPTCRRMNRWIQRRLAEPLIESNHLWLSSFFNDGLCNMTLNSLQFWFKTNIILITKTKLNLSLLAPNDKQCPYFTNHTSFKILKSDMFITCLRQKLAQNLFHIHTLMLVGKYSNRTTMLTKLLWSLI
jgi:hypothetical protein